MNEDEAITCSKCGKETSKNYYMCDQEEDAQWCPDCFPKTACGSGAHGEECPTGVVSS